MNTVRELHANAMKLAQLAMVARHAGESDRAKELTFQAYEYEEKAAHLVPDNQESEPTRSILYRSAASLAHQSKRFRIAQRLVARGLSGYPPLQVERELKNLYEQINFEHHLELNGVVLSNEDVQLSLAGTAVGTGTILYNEFHKRIEQTNRLVTRTVQRLMGREYQKGGSVSKLYKPFIPALSVPRIGSFAITIKLVHSEQLPLVPNAAQVIDEIMDGIELINDANEHRLEELIHDDPYYRNFVSLTRDMAPDGDRINLVGFTSNRKTVAFTRKRQEIKFKATVQQAEEITRENRKPIRIEGILDFASGRKNERLGLTADDGKQYDIQVEAGMDDLVTSYWRQKVAVVGSYDGDYIYPEDIEPLDA